MVLRCARFARESSAITSTRRLNKESGEPQIWEIGEPATERPGLELIKTLNPLRDKLVD